MTQAAVKVYLVRHGRPQFPTGERYCVGRTDLPLSEEGRCQALRLEEYFRHKAVDAVWCSPLARALETARIAAGGAFPVQVEPALTEVDFGPWDGKPFSEIKAAWPELYAARGADKSLFPPQAEPLDQAAQRGLAALERIAAGAQQKKVAVVAHQSLIQAMLSVLQQRPLQQTMAQPLPYGSITLLLWQQGRFTVQSVGQKPYARPVEQEIACWHQRIGTPQAVIEHEKAVAARAFPVGIRLAVLGNSVDVPSLRAAALCHDLFRAQKDHPARCAAFLRAEGYDRLADIVAAHHGEGLAEGKIDEATVLFWADKRVQGARPVTLEQRFAGSLAKCDTPEARAAHARRQAQAEAVEQLLRQAGAADLVD